MCLIALGLIFLILYAHESESFNFFFPIHFLSEFTESFISEKYKLYCQKGNQDGISYFQTSFAAMWVMLACVGMGSIIPCISDGVAVADLQKDSDMSESETVIFLLFGETKGNF